MDLNGIRRQLREEVTMAQGVSRSLTRDSLGEAIQRQVDRLPRDVRKSLSDGDRAMLVQQVIDDILGFGPLQPLLADRSVTEIMVLAPDAVYVERGGIKQLAECRFNDANQVRVIVERMMSSSGRRLDESIPYCDFSLEDGSRVHVIIPPLAVGCAQVTIRKFLDTIRDINDLVTFGTLDERMATFLVACMRAKQSLLFSGATGCGKTTTLAALSSYIDARERIVTIEDTQELNLQQDHVVPLLTRMPNIEGKGEVTLRDLLKNSFRMRPSRILLGEIRGAEAMDYLQAVNSGHRGCCAVLHASSPADAVSRLETLALYAGLNLPVEAIRRQMASGIDVIIQQDQLHDGSRKITHLTAVNGIENGEVKLQDLFRFDLESTDSEGRAHGSFRAVAAPDNLDVFRRIGIDLPKDLFVEPRPGPGP